MGKNTRKPVAPRKSKFTPLCRSSPILRDHIKTKLIRKTPPTPTNVTLSAQIKGLVNEQVLTCSICLQLLLSPVLAPCGHSFCLSCAEDLAKNRFACGICHIHQPDYDLPPSKVIETLIDHHLEECQIGQKQYYEIRKLNLQKKEQNRRLGDVQEGQDIDYWCTQQLVWKKGHVTQVYKNGTLVITPKKGNGELFIHCSSRRLAPLNRFTPQQRIPAPEMQIRPIQMLQNNNSFQGVRMQMEERQPIYGMPLFLGYYWRGEDMIERNGVFDGIDPFTF